jgi:hypothetical protein
VWAVDLERGSSLADQQGTLTLEGEVLSFEPRDEGRRPRRIRLEDIKKVKRLRGSPVLLVAHAEHDRVMRTAFYFIQPPPIDPPVSAPTSPFSLGRSSKRKERRRNVGYLTASNPRKKEELREWESALRAALQGPGS